MTQTFILTFISVVIVSAIPLLAFILFFPEETLKKRTAVLLGLAIGAMIGDVGFHILPEAFRESESALVWVAVGIALFFLFERYLHWHHHSEHSHKHRTGYLILLGDGIHNFVDGLLIAAAFFADTSVGVATTLAVILHEIPQEFGDFGILLHSGFSKARAIRANFFSACTAIVGALAGLLLGSFIERIPSVLLPVTAGGFIYLIFADLAPETFKMWKNQKTFVLVMFLAGVGAMFALTTIE